MRKTLIAGNWKMNSSLLDSTQRVKQLSLILSSFSANIDVVVCPPFTSLQAVVDVCDKVRISVGAQDCHFNVKGAHTGDISADMLKDVGCRYVVLGHSERRADHFETNDLINKKVVATINAGLTPIICVGETKEQKEKGLTLSIIKEQLVGCIPSVSNAENTVIAYEPIWAIGTGLTPTNDDIAKIHLEIRKMLSHITSTDNANKMRILYGGSLNPKNAKEILSIEDVDGGLIGGASLLAEDFYEVIKNVKENIGR
jgi:triosephosphate isomerase